MKATDERKSSITWSSRHPSSTSSSAACGSITSRPIPMSSPLTPARSAIVVRVRDEMCGRSERYRSTSRPKTKPSSATPAETRIAACAETLAAVESDARVAAWGRAAVDAAAVVWPGILLRVQLNHSSSCLLRTKVDIRRGCELLLVFAARTRGHTRDHTSGHTR